MVSMIKGGRGHLRSINLNALVPYTMEQSCLRVWMVMQWNGNVRTAVNESAH